GLRQHRRRPARMGRRRGPRLRQHAGRAACHAAMLFLPDFVEGEFLHRMCDPSIVGYVPVQPLNVPSFTFVGMSWPLPAVAPHRDQAVEFLTVVGSVAGQAAFNPTKGSIPANTSVDVTMAGGFGAIQVQTAADFKLGQSGASKLVLGWAASTPSD